MIIAGERDQESEVQNDEGNTKWNKAGVYDEETGLFYIRENEHISIHRHFKELRNNRMSSKKSIRNFAYKTAPEQHSFKPTISEKTTQISN